jgi:hypothetical protein
MLQRITLILILHLCINQVFGQQQYAVNLLGFEERIFRANKDAVDLIKLEKINYMINADSTKGHILSELKRVNYSLLPDSLRVNALWNAALIAYLNKEMDLSFLYWSKYNTLTNDTSTQSILLGYLTSENLNKTINRSLYAKLISCDSQFVQFDDELHKSIDLKGNTFKKVSSLLLPGSGLLINGNIGKGLLSMSLNTGTFFFVRFLISNNAWVNSVLWGSNLVGKFYLGGYRLTSKEIDNKERRKQKMRAETSAHLLTSILVKYPLSLRLVY